MNKVLSIRLRRNPQRGGYAHPKFEVCTSILDYVTPPVAHRTVQGFDKLPRSIQIQVTADKVTALSFGMRHRIKFDRYMKRVNIGRINGGPYKPRSVFSSFIWYLSRTLDRLNTANLLYFKVTILDAPTKQKVMDFRLWYGMYVFVDRTKRYAYEVSGTYA